MQIVSESTLKERRLVTDMSLHYDITNSHLNCPFLIKALGIEISTRRPQRVKSLFHEQIQALIT